LAKTPRGWTGARTPSAIKRVRQAERRRAINQPRRTAAKTYAANAVKVATGAAQAIPPEALAQAMSALDKAAKVGVIHPNNAARRKSRLALRLNGPRRRRLGSGRRSRRQEHRHAAAIKAARTRIASGKAVKAKGPQTAAGKARAALSKDRPLGRRSRCGLCSCRDRAKAKAAPKGRSQGRAEGQGRTKAAAAKARPRPRSRPQRRRPRQGREGLGQGREAGR